jgi:23S rRNA pseudouridine2457 synthase
MESQFVANYPANLLGDLNFDFPEGIHAIGRLDKYSEGLLLLTTNKKITRLLFQGKTPHARTYVVQVKHKINEANLERLRKGVSIVIKGGTDYITPACEVNPVDPCFSYPSPVNISAMQATTWLEIKLTEGKYHQVRKMVRVAGHRCLRLVRTSIEDLHLGKLQPGEVKEINEEEFFNLLKL